MKVFLSWSGERSKAAATAFRDWLPMVLQNATPWMSDVDIKAGDRWNTELQIQLQDSKLGMAFLTPDNLASPWLLFEMGALAKSVDVGRAIPYLVGVAPADIPRGPLIQFQYKVADESGTWDVIHAINCDLKDKGLEESRLRLVFSKWYPDLETQIAQVSREEVATQEKRNPGKDREEILETVREISRRLSFLEDVARRSDKSSRLGTLKRFVEEGLIEDSVIPCESCGGESYISELGKVTSIDGAPLALCHACQEKFMVILPSLLAR